MSLLDNKPIRRQPMPTDLKVGGIAWLGTSSEDKRIRVEITEISENPCEDTAMIAEFIVLNGGWSGELRVDAEEGALQIVDERGEIHYGVYLVEIEE